MKKKIALVTGTERTMISLKEQLDHYLKDIAKIDTFISDYGIDSIIHADLVVISSELIYDDIAEYLPKGCNSIIAKRIINFSELEKVLAIKEGEDILLVNDVKETTLECIDWLNKLGLNQYHYIPYYEGCAVPDKIKYVVTPGELALVPVHAEEVIDIGPRIIDMTTLTEILKILDVFEENWEEISMLYLNKIIESSKKLVAINKQKTQAYENISKVIDSVNEGILSFNGNMKITVINENLKSMLGINKQGVIGKSIKQIFKGALLDYLLASNIKESLVEIRGNTVKVSKIEIDESSTVITFKPTSHILETEQLFKRDLYKKGYYAKYTFEDIIGNSEVMKTVKKVARKLALTELTVLIEGESGTGKELFASAIHDSSSRKDKPFVAVNFSALSETLVESELFGYEEGAFTGAVKGGKPGLFEQADGGTIFLDEIGDISPKVQSRLLRVLQEKELMRVGGNKIISIDVRVIAATNQNLYTQVIDGLFRSDLYHRLKVLYIKLPALRDRIGDVEALLSHFMEKRGRQDIFIKEEVVKKLIGYPWNGNVRELNNTIDYMLSVCEDNIISINDLPEESFFIESEKIIKNPKEEIEISARKDLRFLLKALYDMTLVGEVGSRQKLLYISKDSDIVLTEQTLRKRLDELENVGYLIKSKGKGGTKLSPQGIEFVKKNIY